MSDFTMVIRRMRPANVEAVQITHENIDAVALFYGGQITHENVDSVALFYGGQLVKNVDDRKYLYVEHNGSVVRAGIGDYLCWNGYVPYVMSSEDFPKLFY